MQVGATHTNIVPLRLQMIFFSVCEQNVETAERNESGPEILSISKEQPFPPD